LINAFLEGVSAKSAGVNAKGKVNENARKVLKNHGIWSDEYYSKNIDEVIHENFDLIVTVCENAKETCPTFPKKTKTIHIGFEDPDGKEFEAFEKTYEEIKTILLPKIKKVLEEK
jgi:arsenate reductase